MRTSLLQRGRAFAVLRVAGQDGNLKLVDVATEVVETGTPSLRRRLAGALSGRVDAPTVLLVAQREQNARVPDMPERSPCPPHRSTSTPSCPS